MKSLKERVFESNIELVKRGMVIYTWGNVSGIDREKGIVIIKPRGVSYDGMTADDMVTVDMDGNVIEGRYLPSVDLDIHLELYRRFPALGGIAHTHSTYATAWAQACKSIPALGTTHADEFYGSVPCTRPFKDNELGSDYEKKTGEIIAEAFEGKDPMDFFGALVAYHGPFTWGATPESSVEKSVILEEVAKMATITLNINPELTSMPKGLLDKHFLRKHGPTAYFYQHQGKK